MLEPSIEYDDGDIYYGSTTQPLYKRFFQHKKSFIFNRPIKSKMLFEKYGIKNTKIILIKYFPCENRRELEAEEATYIRNYKCVNSNIPGRSDKEWRETHKEIIKEKQKVYNVNNKETIKENQNEYIEKNKETIKGKKKEYYIDNKEKLNKQNNQNYKKKKGTFKEKRKEYREANKEKFKEYRKEHIKEYQERDKKYYETNKENILEKMKERIICECGCEVNKCGLKRHQASKKHINLMNKI